MPDATFYAFLQDIPPELQDVFSQIQRAKEAIDAYVENSSQRSLLIRSEKRRIEDISKNILGGVKNVECTSKMMLDIMEIIEAIEKNKNSENIYDENSIIQLEKLHVKLRRMAAEIHDNSRRIIMDFHALSGRMEQIEHFLGKIL